MEAILESVETGQPVRISSNYRRSIDPVEADEAGGLIRREGEIISVLESHPCSIVESLPSWGDLHISSRSMALGPLPRESGSVPKDTFWPS